MFGNFLSVDSTLLLVLIALWTIPWKAVALWKAAGAKHKGWFVALLLLNTLAILEIVYIFFFNKKGHELFQADQPSDDARADGQIAYSEFAKLDLRIGTVVSAEAVSGSDKLVRLEVDLGGETRQLVAGIAKAYSLEKLKDRQIVVLANLEPKKLMGLESQGMLLAAAGDKPVLLMPDAKVKPGAKIS